MKQWEKVVSIILLVVAVLVLGPSSYAAETKSATVMDRTVLPIQEPKRPVYKELDVRNAKMPPNF